MRYQVTVKPGAKREEIILTDSDFDEDPKLTVYLRARAHDGEANTALIKALSKYFYVGKTSIRIIRGEKSRKKVIEILE